MNVNLRSTVTVALVTGSQKEEQTRSQLLALMERYDLRKWQFTDQIQVEEGAIPHSHPILTLNTRYLTDDAMLLSDYVHEQLHWFTLANSEASRCAIGAFRQRYTAVPVDVPEGCGSEWSNYLHFLVCYLEHKGIVELLGPTDAEAAMERKLRRPFYRYVYRTVRDDFNELGRTVAGCGISL